MKGKEYFLGVIWFIQSRSTETPLEMFLFLHQLQWQSGQLADMKMSTL